MSVKNKNKFYGSSIISDVSIYNTRNPINARSIRRRVKRNESRAGIKEKPLWCERRPWESFFIPAMCVKYVRICRCRWARRVWLTKVCVCVCVVVGRVKMLFETEVELSPVSGYIGVGIWEGKARCAWFFGENFSLSLCSKVQIFRERMFELIY